MYICSGGHVRRRNIINKKFEIAPYLFLIPTMLIFMLFVFYPFLQTIVKSFAITDTRGSITRFVGTRIYETIFTDQRFLDSLLLSFRFALIVGIPTLTIGFILAVIAMEKRHNSTIYETMFALPMAIASAPAAVIWLQLMRSNRSGLLNYVLGTEIQWLLDADYAIYAVGLVTVWLAIGINFIFLLTGLRNVDSTLIESAKIDGAGYLSRLKNIVIPVASPQIFFVLFFNIITSFQSFSQIRILTQGGPSYSTNVLVYSIYTKGIRDSRYETAFAQSVVLFIIILVITLIQFRFEKKVVHYQ